jgi:hypothetical protein
MKFDTQSKHMKALLKNGGTRFKELDDQMRLRNKNIKAASLTRKIKFEKETSKNNLILGKKMQEIFTRKKSNYGEVTMKESPSRKIDIKGFKFNQSS